MMLKTKIFVAKHFAKKHYAGAMDAMKSLKGKAKTATLKGLSKGKTIASGIPAKVGKLAKTPTAKDFGQGAKIGTFIAGGLAVGSSAYNIATGKKNVRVDKKTAARLKIKKLKKQYNV